MEDLSKMPTSSRYCLIALISQTTRLRIERSAELLNYVIGYYLDPVNVRAVFHKFLQELVNTVVGFWHRRVIYCRLSPISKSLVSDIPQSALGSEQRILYSR